MIIYKTYIHFYTFFFVEGLAKLTEINLSQNCIEILDPKIFQELNNLAKIDLSYNFLTEIDQKMFTGLTNITHIWLNNNK